MGIAAPAAASVAALAAALAAHYLLTRAARRLPLVLGRRLGGAEALARGTHLAWQRRLAWAVALPKVAAWLAALRVVGREFPALERDARAVAGFLLATFTKPMFAVSDRSYSALDVVLLPAALGGLWVAVSGLTRLVQSRLARATSGGNGAPEAFGILVRYVLAFFGGILVLQLWGIDLRSLAIVASVLGVGIGFGLQHIANNFISGLAISLERPIRPGDFVTVGGLTGVVERVGARSTEIRTIDRVKILVPNSKFLETEVVNWNHGDPTSRLHVPVAVAYGSDVPLVRATLLEVARTHPEVLAEPRPEVHFRGFADSALSLELLVWTADPSRQSALVSDLNYRIDAAFRRRRIQIPFPQRDLHLRSPALEQALAAWTHAEAVVAPGDARNGTAASAARAGGEADTGAGLAGEDAEASIGPREWTDDALHDLAARMRGPHGVRIGERRHLLRSYARCFVGSEAVDWIADDQAITRREAEKAGQLLVERGLVHHVLDEHPFRDAFLFYRFRADERAGDERAEAASPQPA